MSVLTTTDPVRWIQQRIIKRVGDGSPITPEEILAAMNEGYQLACGQAGCIEYVYTLATADGVQEYSLPGDLYRTRAVYAGGTKLTQVWDRQAVSGSPDMAYYQRAGVIGFPVVPTTTGPVLIRYVATPPPLDLPDTPDPSFGPEWYYLLYHYGTYRAMAQGSGAQDAVFVATQRQAYDAGVSRLRKQVKMLDRSQVLRAHSPTEVGYAR